MAMRVPVLVSVAASHMDVGLQQLASRVNRSPRSSIDCLANMLCKPKSADRMLQPCRGSQNAC